MVFEKEDIIFPIYSSFFISKIQQEKEQVNPKVESERFGKRMNG
jgi:hypothetical protein